MSLFPSFGYIGGEYNGPCARYAPASEAPAPAPDEPVKPLPAIERPYAYAGGYGSFPGFGTAPAGTPWLYWQMRRYSAIVLAHAVVTAPILAGTQSVEIRDDQGNPDEAERRKALAEKHLLPLLADVLPGAMESLHFGHWLLSVNWDRRDDLTVPVSVDSLLPGEATIFRDEFRRFTGFQVGSEFRDARYGFLCVNEWWIDPIFGYSRNENCREDWWRAIQSELNADKVEKKAAGIQMMIGVPQGSTFVDDAGNPIFPKDLVQTITNAAVQGQTFVVPLTPFKYKDIVSNPDLANQPAVRVDKFDWGEIGPKLLAHLSRMDRTDRSIMRAWHRPEREALEGEHGTKAEAGTHGAIGTTDSELVHQQVLRQFSRQVLDRWLVTNFGADAAGTLHLKAAPLADPQQEFLQKVSEVLAQNQQTGPDFVRQIDLRSLAHRTEIPILSEEDVAAKKAEEDQQAADAAAQQAKQNQPPGANGANGNGNGRGGQNGTGKPRIAASATDRLMERMLGVGLEDEGAVGVLALGNPNHDERGRFTTDATLATDTGTGSIIVKGDELGAGLDAAGYRAAAKKFAVDQLQGRSFVNRETGRTIQIGRKGIGKIISSSADIRKAKAVVAIPEMIERGVGCTKGRSSDTKFRYYRFDVAVEIEGSAQPMNFLVREDRNGHWYYNHNMGPVTQ